MARYFRTPTPSHASFPVNTATGNNLADFASVPLIPSFRNLWKALRNRVTARSLIDLSDYELADIGLSRSDVHAGFRSTEIDPTIEIACRARQNGRCMEV